MPKFILGLFLLQLSSCAYVNYAHAPVNVFQSAAADANKVVCADPSVMALATYRLPPPPDIDSIKPGDRKAEVMMLLDYIDTLRGEIRTHVKDYDCAVK